MTERSFDKHASLIDNPGRAHLQSVLKTNPNPGKAILELQDTFGLKYSSTIALPLLDLLEVSRASVYQTLFDTSKTKLEELLQKLPQQKLIALLSVTFRYITVRDLKSIPVAIIKRLNDVPEKFLKALANKRLHHVLEEIPMHVRRQVWHVDPSYFETVVSDLSQTWLDENSKNGNTRPSPPTEEFRDFIGDSVFLFGKFAKMCCKNVILEKSMAWSVLLRRTIVSIRKEKLPALGKLRDLSLQVDHCIRERTIDAAAVASIIAYLSDIKRAADISGARIELRTGGSTPSSAPSLSEKLKTAWKTLHDAKCFSIFRQPAIQACPDQRTKDRYAALVPRPMDLSEMQRKLDSYSSLDEFDADIELILDNCRRFNGPGYYTNMADKCSALWSKKKAMIFNTTVPVPPPKKSRQQSPNIKPTPSADHTSLSVRSRGDMENSSTHQELDELQITKRPRIVREEKKDQPQLNLQTVLTSAWDYISSLDKDGIFAQPVAELLPTADAKRYLSVIKKPMDLSTMKSKLERYKTVDEFEADLELMVENCKTFYGEADEYYQLGRRFISSWKEKKESLLHGANMSNKSQSAPSVRAAPSRERPVLTPITDTQQREVAVALDNKEAALERAWDYISSLDHDGIFAKPVTDMDAPGYSATVRKPMDMSTIQSKLFKYRSIPNFEADLRLMLENCLEYNDPRGDYELSDFAVQIWEDWLVNRADVLLGREVKAVLKVNRPKKSRNSNGGGNERVKPTKRQTVIKDDDWSDGDDDDDNFDEDETDDYTSKKPRSGGNSKNTRKNKTGVSRSVKQKSAVVAPIIPAVPLHVQANLKSRASVTTDASTVSSHQPSAAPKISNSSKQPVVNPHSSNSGSRNHPSHSTGVSGKDVLLWATVILRDFQLRELLIEYLASVMQGLVDKNILPMDDDNARNSIYLIQFNMHFEPSYPVLNQHLLRTLLPKLMLESVLHDGDREGVHSIVDTILQAVPYDKDIVTDIITKMYSELVK